MPNMWEAIWPGSLSISWPFYVRSVSYTHLSNTVLRQVSIDVSFFFDGGTSEYDQLSFQEKEGLTIYDNLEGRLQFAEIDKLDPGETFTMEGAFKVGDVEYLSLIHI